MAKRHWLDPLARRLLIACGQITPDPGPEVAADPTTVSSGTEDDQEAVEQDLMALRLALDPAQPLRDGDDVRRAAALGWRLDVNRATAADWRRLPGCGPERVDLLERLRRGGVQLSGPEDLQAVLDLDAQTLASWLPLLTFRWYGDAAPAPAAPLVVAVNLADAGSLTRLPELTPERRSRLLRERARGPFRDLADLRDRLGLPAAVVERWIGLVSFQEGPAGPQLPPTRARPQGR